jgi:hydroxyacylglutathione hydrolase
MNTYRRIALGFTNTYLVPGKDGYLLVDAGSRGTHRLFFRRLSQMGISPESIRLIVITHAHFDHIGCLQEIKQRCGCQVAAHSHEKKIMEAGELVIPPGTIDWIDRLCRFARKHPDLIGSMYRFRAVDVEMEIDSPTRLHEFGFAATVIPTPGHTRGSLSVLTDDGTAFVGDLAVNFPVLRVRGRRYLPPFGDDVDRILKSWKDLLERGGKEICQSHGLPFSAERLHREIGRFPHNGV